MVVRKESNDLDYVNKVRKFVLICNFFFFDNFNLIIIEIIDYFSYLNELLKSFFFI